MNEILALLEKYGIQLAEAAEPVLIEEGKKLALDVAEKALVFTNVRIKNTQNMLTEVQAAEKASTLFHGKLWDKVKVEFVEVLLAIEEKAAEAITAEIAQLQPTVAPTETVSNPAN
jgi:hypothetical protein